MSICANILHSGYGFELISAHTHLILVGSVMMMIMGVALWFFPRPEKDDKRYNPDSIRLAYWTMTISTFLRFISQVTVSFDEIQVFRLLITLFSIGQVAAIIIFFYGIWGRIRSSGGSRLREERGEKF